MSRKRRSNLRIGIFYRLLRLAAVGYDDARKLQGVDITARIAVASVRPDLQAGRGHESSIPPDANVALFVPREAIDVRRIARRGFPAVTYNSPIGIKPFRVLVLVQLECDWRAFPGDGHPVSEILNRQPFVAVRIIAVVGIWRSVGVNLQWTHPHQ